MTFVQLVDKLRIKCGVTGSITTVVGLTGESARLAAWINDAWMDIQSAHQDWGWMRKSATVPTVAGQYSYDPATDFSLTDFGRWDAQSFRCYETSVGTPSELFMDLFSYDAWRNTYLIGTMRDVRTRPTAMAVSPAKAIVLGPVPAAGYTVIGDYFSVPSELALDADTPALPAQFHMAIIYRAMMFYGSFESAPEVYQEGQVEFDKLMRRIAIDRLPEMEVPGAIA